MRSIRPCLMFAVLGFTWPCVAAAPGLSQEAVPTGAPIAVQASTVGRFSRGYSWHLKVTADGAAALSIATFPTPTERHFTVSPRQLAALRAVVEREQFFSLSDEYGQNVPDSSTTTITVSLGDRQKSVTLRYLMNWVYSDPGRLQEPARALRVLHVCRGWFDDGQAVDLRRYDALVLKAAGGPTKR